MFKITVTYIGLDGRSREQVATYRRAQEAKVAFRRFLGMEQATDVVLIGPTGKRVNEWHAFKAPF